VVGKGETSPRGVLAALWRSDILPTLSLGLPLVGAQIAQMAINTTDVLMIGRLGASELAASVLAFNMFILFWFFGMGLIQAVIPLAARARGKRAMRDLRRSVRMGFWVVALYCFPVWILFLFSEEIWLFLGQDPKVSALAADYLNVLKWTMFPSLSVMAVRAFLTVMERAQVVLWATVAGALANAVLDYGLIFGEFGFPRLELVGAAIASVFSATLTMFILFFYAGFHPKLRRLSIFGRIWRSDWPVLREIMRLGVPIALTIVAEGALFSATAIMMGWIGTLPLAGHGIALQICSLTFMVPVGLSQAALIRVGLAHGRQDREGVGRAGWTALVITLCFMSLFAVTFWMFSNELVSLYLDANNPNYDAVLAFGASFLIIGAIFQLADGAQIVGGSNLRGLGDTKIPLYYALFGYWLIGISLSLGFGFVAGLGGVGIWSGLVGGLLTVALFANYRFYRREALGLC
jgi:MATE family multidrug resistance protein